MKALFKRALVASALVGGVLLSSAHSAGAVPVLDPDARFTCPTFVGAVGPTLCFYEHAGYAGRGLQYSNSEFDDFGYPQRNFTHMTSSIVNHTDRKLCLYDARNKSNHNDWFMLEVEPHHAFNDLSKELDPKAAPGSTDNTFNDRVDYWKTVPNTGAPCPLY